MTPIDAASPGTPSRTRTSRAGRALRAVVGGGSAAWLAAQFFGVAVVLRPGVEEPSLGGLASAVAYTGALGGIACVLYTPVAAVLALGARRIPGGAAVACSLAGAAGGATIALLLGSNTLAVALPGAAVGAVCGLAGWAGARWASGSVVRTAALAVVAAVLYAVAYVLVVSGGGV